MVDEVVTKGSGSMNGFEWGEGAQSVSQNTAQTLGVVSNEVQKRFDQHTATANAQIKAVNDAIKRLTDAAAELDIEVPPIQAVPFDPLDVSFTKPTFNTTDFGQVEVGKPPDVPDLTRPSIDIPEFQTIITEFNIPDSEPWVDVGPPPTKPLIVEVTFPEDEEFVMPDAPKLEDVVFPDFEKLEIPTFSGALPGEFTDKLELVFDYAPTTYLPERVEELLPTLKAMWQGQGGLPKAVQDAMLARSRDLEDLTLSQDLDAVRQDFASRGFNAPPGMLAARQDMIRRESALRKSTAARDLNIRFSEIVVEQIRFGVEQYVAAENAMYNIFSNQADRAFEVAKYTTEMAMRVYDAAIAAHNANLQRSQLEVQIFSERVKGALAELELDRLELEKAIAKGQVNEQLIRIYAERVNAVRATIEVYKTKMQAASVKADVNRTIIEGFKAEVTAYGELNSAQESKYRAYEARVRGEAAKAQIISAEAQVFGSVVQGKVAQLEADIAGNKAAIDIHLAQLKVFEAQQKATSESFDGKIKAHFAAVERYKADISLEQAAGNVAITQSEAKLRSTIAFFDATMKQFQVAADIAAKKYELMQDAAKTVAQVSSTLAAGAMAGIHVGTQFNGSGQVQLEANFTESKSVSAQVGG